MLFHCISAYVRVYLHAATSVVVPLLAFQARTFQNTLCILGDNIVLLLSFTCTSTNITTGDEDEINPSVKAHSQNRVDTNKVHIPQTPRRAQKSGDTARFCSEEEHKCTDVLSHRRV